MKIKDMKKGKIDGLVQYSAKPKDEQGSDVYELTVTGPSDLTLKLFKDSDFDVSIRPRATEEDAKAAIADLAGPAKLIHADLEPGFSTRKKGKPKQVTAQNSVYVSLRRIEGNGTLWLFNINAVILPAGMNLFFSLPPVFTTTGMVIPSLGDADLFLSLNSPFAPAVSFSLNAGLRPDLVSYASFPFPFPFVPFFRVNGFLRSVTSFIVIGFSIP